MKRKTGKSNNTMVLFPENNFNTRENLNALEKYKINRIKVIITSKKNVKNFELLAVER